MNAFPILNYDPDRSAILQPNHAGHQVNMPGCLVICFFKEVVERVAAEQEAELLFTVESEAGHFPMYAIEYWGKRVGILHPGVGAPFAAMLMENAIRFGARHIVACGGCGVLDQRVAVGHVLLPVAAYREEGVSYHYLPPAEKVEIDPWVIGVLESVLQERQVDYLLTKAWTTDAVYRETPAKARHYLASGCLAVEMEMAALAAVASFRGVAFGQYLYAGDAVIPDAWDGREWNRTNIRQALFWLAAEASVRMSEGSMAVTNTDF